MVPIQPQYVWREHTFLELTSEGYFAVICTFHAYNIIFSYFFELQAPQRPRPTSDFNQYGPDPTIICLARTYLLGTDIRRVFCTYLHVLFISRVFFIFFRAPGLVTAKSVLWFQNLWHHRDRSNLLEIISSQVWRKAVIEGIKTRRPILARQFGCKIIQTAHYDALTFRKAKNLIPSKPQ
jgi:hypothetical protein